MWSLHSILITLGILPILLKLKKYLFLINIIYIIYKNIINILIIFPSSIISLCPPPSESTSQAWRDLCYFREDAVFELSCKSPDTSSLPVLSYPSVIQDKTGRGDPVTFCSLWAGGNLSLELVEIKESHHVIMSQTHRVLALKHFVLDSTFLGGCKQACLHKYLEAVRQACFCRDMRGKGGGILGGAPSFPMVDCPECGWAPAMLPQWGLRELQVWPCVLPAKARIDRVCFQEGFSAEGPRGP